MRRDYYVTPRPSWVMRQFWRAAGGDRFILERSTYSDQVKYMCLGGIIVATGVMAGIAGGYAFYTIFSPRNPVAIEEEVNYPITLLSIAFGFIWGLMIFNIDRFIVTSTGKGDGTEAITWDEFKGAIPRIIMGAIIAVTISKPVEIRMFKTEIDVKLYEKQLEAEKKFKEQVNANYEDRLKLVDQDLAKVEEQRNKLQDLLNETIRKKNEIATQTVTRYVTRKDSEGNDIEVQIQVAHPGVRSYQRQIDDLEQQMTDFNNKNAEKIRRIEANRDSMLVNKDQIFNKNRKVAASLDGLLERIHLAHEVAGFWISLFITLLFMVIELTPIFFKLMLIKSPYDYLEENIKELIRAEEGISIRYNYYPNKGGAERDYVQFLRSEHITDSQRDSRDTERRLALYALEAYEKAMKRKIDENPEAFVKLNEKDQNKF
jgi:hypothetical protein